MTAIIISLAVVIQYYYLLFMHIRYMWQLFSRAGLWMFDLAATQIAQQTIPENSRGTINGQWRSITAFFDMTTYIVAIVCSNPEEFGFLCFLSACSVGAAAITYTTTVSTNSCYFRQNPDEAYTKVAHSPSENVNNFYSKKKKNL